jgi:hypothetical protein
MLLHITMHDVAVHVSKSALLMLTHIVVQNVGNPPNLSTEY